MTAVSAEMEPDSPISRGSSEVLVDRVLVVKAWLSKWPDFFPTTGAKSEATSPIWESSTRHIRKNPYYYRGGST